MKRVTKILSGLIINGLMTGMSLSCFGVNVKAGCLQDGATVDFIMPGGAFEAYGSKERALAYCGKVVAQEKQLVSTNEASLFLAKTCCSGNAKVSKVSDCRWNETSKAYAGGSTVGSEYTQTRECLSDAEFEIIQKLQAEKAEKLKEYYLEQLLSPVEMRNLYPEPKDVLSGEF